jgi:hypothetical protein
MFKHLLRVTISVLLFVTSLHAQVPAELVAANREKRQAPKTDGTIEAAMKLNMDMPVMCREFHIWTSVPYGNPLVPEWRHVSDPMTGIEQTVPGLAWRRYLNCTGYPLLGPYDSAQRDIIRWQLQTAKNTGLQCLAVHLWPSLWDDGLDFTPLPILDTVLDEAVKQNYPVMFHDEIMFRRPPITKAQDVKHSVKRTVSLLKHYKDHPGFYRIDGLPVYYFQNFSGWLDAPKMQAYFEQVEAQVGPVYWMVSGLGKDTEACLKIPQLKAVLPGGSGWFLHTPPFGQGPHPWDVFEADMIKAYAKIKAAGKAAGLQVMTRFNNHNDRGKPGTGRIDAEDGMFLVKSMDLAKRLESDFVMIHQWNDFEESAFIEPAWDMDGWNGDPYRYCKIVAATMGKTFTPAPLPKRETVDPYVRHKLYGDTKPGDMGPIARDMQLTRNQLTWQWSTGSGDPVAMHIAQKTLVQWSSDKPVGVGLPMQLGNFSQFDDGSLTLKNKLEARFFIPGMVMGKPEKVWVALEAKLGEATDIRVEYQAVHEEYRVDSRWTKRHVMLANNPSIQTADGYRMYWFPLYGAHFNGSEGDLFLMLKGKNKATSIRRIMIWHPDMADLKSPVTWQKQKLTLPKTIDTGLPMVIVPVDTAGNTGYPNPVIDGKMLQSSTAEPMTVLLPDVIPAETSEADKK